MKEFEGKVALVTGGGSGIGRAAALAFARDGARVVIGNRNVQRGEETVSMIRAAGGTASFRRTDVLVAADIEALVKHAVSEYGGLDLAFNNAGIEGEVRPLVEQTEANYDAVMDINVKGVWLSMKYEIPRMLDRCGGAIVNCVGGRIDWVSKHRDLHRVEARGDRSYQDRRVGVLRARDPGKCGQPGSDRYGDGRPNCRGVEYGKERPLHLASHRPPGASRRSGRGGIMALFRQSVVCYGAQSACRRGIHGALIHIG